MINNIIEYEAQCFKLIDTNKIDKITYTKSCWQLLNKSINNIIYINPFIIETSEYKKMCDLTTYNNDSGLQYIYLHLLKDSDRSEYIRRMIKVIQSSELIYKELKPILKLKLENISMN
jgi:hypothetical protein